MPAATVPVSKPSAPKKPAGFTKPAGFSKPVVEEEEDDEPQKDNKVILGIAALSVLLMLLFGYLQYGVDQTVGRHTDGDRLFGSPVASESSGDYAGSEAAPAEESADEEESASEDESSDAGESSDEDDYSDIDE